MDEQSNNERKEGENGPVEVISGENEGHLLQPLEEEVHALSAKVFGIDLLRDIIVDHAIHQGSGSLDTATICALRSLGTDSNDSVCRLFHKKGEPLYKIYLGNWNRLNGLVRNEATTPEFLDRFPTTFAISSRVLGRPPTFELAVSQFAFQQENYDTVYKFLLGCGEGLVKICFDIGRYQNLMEGMFPNIFLPSLSNAIVHCDDSLPRRIGKMSYLLQSLFSGAGRLKQLKIWQYQPAQPSVFKGVFLPLTLTRLDLQADFNSEDLETLLCKNPLPNLASLTVSLSNDQVTPGLLSRILEKVGLTLISLHLERDIDHVEPEDMIFLRFPIMKKLEVFEVSTANFVPETSRIPSLEAYLPKLRMLQCFDPTIEMIMKWMNGSRFISVHVLKIEAVSVSLNFDSELLGQINLSFPNVTKLELRFTEISPAALQYIFMGMGNLVELKMVKFRLDNDDDDQIPIDWNSVLIGTPIQLAAELRATPKLWDDEDPSIRKLTELRSFTLEDHSLDEPLVIDMTFRLAFLEMRQLLKLEFSDKFSVSQEMADMWRASGRFLNYTE